jgi:hypothetical protein
MRVSTLFGKRLVTTTSGFFFGIETRWLTEA